MTTIAVLRQSVIDGEAGTTLELVHKAFAENSPPEHILKAVMKG